MVRLEVEAPPVAGLIGHPNDLDPSATGSGGPGYAFDDELVTVDAPQPKGAPVTVHADEGPRPDASLGIWAAPVDELVGADP